MPYEVVHVIHVEVIRKDIFIYDLTTFSVQISADPNKWASPIVLSVHVTPGACET